MIPKDLCFKIYSYTGDPSIDIPAGFFDYLTIERTTSTEPMIDCYLTYRIHDEYGITPIKLLQVLDNNIKALDNYISEGLDDEDFYDNIPDKFEQLFQAFYLFSRKFMEKEDGVLTEFLYEDSLNNTPVYRKMISMHQELYENEPDLSLKNYKYTDPKDCIFKIKDIPAVTFPNIFFQQGPIGIWIPNTK